MLLCRRNGFFIYVSSICRQKSGTRNSNFLDEKFLTAKQILVEAPALGAIALVFDYVEHGLTLLAPCHARKYFNFELRILESRLIVNNIREIILHKLGHDRGKLADLQDYGSDLLNILLFGQFFDNPYNLN